MGASRRPSMCGRKLLKLVNGCLQGKNASAAPKDSLVWGVSWATIVYARAVASSFTGVPTEYRLPVTEQLRLVRYVNCVP